MPAQGHRSAGTVAVIVPVLVVLLAGVVPASAQQAPEARGIERVCPAPAQGAQHEFADAGEAHGAAITCAAAYGLVGGFDDGTFRPAEPVTRGQMATFVAGWVEAATGIALSVPDESPFEDVEGSVHREAVDALAEAGIVGGRGDGTFGPDVALSRGQFARSVATAISYADVFRTDGPLPPDAEESYFDDVEGTTFETEIGALARAGIAVGDASGSFSSDVRVTRGQLATFLMRSADYLDRHQRWRPTAAVQVLVGDLDAAALVDTGGATGVSGTAVLTVNAFNGTLAYTLDLASVPGPYGGDGAATIRAGGPGTAGPVLVTLADGAALDDAEGGVLTGVVNEADSEVRFADLVEHPGDAYVLVATEDHPDGAVRGQLVLATP